jgi:hypothetical protein
MRQPLNQLTEGRRSARRVVYPLVSPCRLTHPAGGLVTETERQTSRPAPVPQLLSAVRERMPNPVRFGLYLVLASTPLLAISGEVFGVVSLRATSTLFLFPLLGILAVLVIFKPAGIDPMPYR